MNIDKAQRYAEDKRGRMISEVLVKDNEKVWWECEREHRWEATANNIVYMKRWCPFCYRDRIGSEDKKKKFMKWVEQNNYHLTSEYVNRAEQVVVSCDRGHEWKVRPTNIVNSTRCPYCSGRIPSREKLDEIMMERRWIMIGEFTEARSQIMTFRCERGHVFKALFDQIRRKLLQCRDCREEDKKESKKPDETHYDSTKRLSGRRWNDEQT